MHPVTQSQLVELKEGKPVTTSLMVAEKFEKNHNHVLRDIKGLIEGCPADFTESNFGLSEYTDSTGRKLPMYILTRDAFSLLVMGFTGPKALQFKLDFIAAFNRMETALKNGGGIPIEFVHHILDANNRTIQAFGRQMLAGVELVAKKMAAAPSQPPKPDPTKADPAYLGPETAFIEKHCHRGPGYRCAKEELYDCYLEYCRLEDQPPRGRSQALKIIYNAFECARPGTMTLDGKRVPAVVGIRPA